MFAAVAAAAVGGIAFFGLVSWIERKTIIWREPEDL
jgi:ABC-type nitrate/sulfonate/bicarbonate transport system permease component